MYNKVIAELGGEEISQVVVNSSYEVSIVREEDPLIVNLGTSDFKERWGRYLALKPTISSDYKNVIGVDLRYRNRVILRHDTDGEVIWDGKKKSL